MNDSPIRILVIDDEENVRKGICYFLEDQGFEVESFEDGPSGLIRISQGVPDLVLLDLRMPKMDGLEVLTRLKAEHPAIPVIMVSGNGSMGDVVEALRRGAWDYLIKPIEDLSILKLAIDKAVDRARLVAENNNYREHLESLVETRTHELKRSNDSLHSLISRLHGVVSTMRLISGLSRTDQFGTRLLEAFGKHLNARGGCLYFLKDQQFELVHSLDPGHAMERLSDPPPSETVLAWVCTRKIGMLIPDLAADSRFSSSGWADYSDASILAFPLLGETGKVVGLLSLHNRVGPPFSDQDFELGSILASYSGEALAAAESASAVKQSEERMDLALRGADLGMWDWNVPSGAMIFDRRTEELLEYGPGELEPRVEKWESHVHEEDLEQALATLDRHLEGQTNSFECEYRVRTRSGGIRWVLDRGKVVHRDQDGQAIRVTGTHLDITERKTVELALRTSEIKFRAIIEDNPVPMLISEGQSIEFLNRAFFDQFGYKREDIPDMARFWALAFPDLGVRDAVSRDWQTQGQDLAQCLPEWELTCRDGEVCEVEVKVLVLGELTVTTFMDVTERKLAERRISELNMDLSHRIQTRTAQLEATREELIGANQRAGIADLATGTIHNIGNILTSVNVSTEEVSARLENSKIKSLVMVGDLLHAHEENLTDFLVNDPKGKQVPAFFMGISRKIKKEFEQLKQDIAFLNTKIDIMRDVISSQQTYARQINNNECVAVVDLAEHAIKLQRHALDRGAVSVVREFLEAPVGSFPRVKLTHVLVNLIKNACESMESCAQQGRKPVLTIRVGREAHLYYIQVTDNGLGIEEKHLPLIFHHGFTTKTQGHGFGLHTSSRWMEELGGKITVSSEGVDQGATFTVWFQDMP